MRRKVLFIAEAVTSAHVTRPLVLAEGLDRPHYEVFIAASAESEPHFAGRGWPFHPLTTISPREFMSDLDAMRPPYTEARLARYVEAELALFDEVKPDIVVGDFRLSLGISCDLAKVPYVNLTTGAHWSPYYRGEYVLPEYGFVRALGVSLSQALFQVIKTIPFHDQARGYNRLRRRYGLSAQGDIRHVYCGGNWVLYPDIPSLVPLAGQPDNHRFIGPVLYQPRAALPEWWDQIPADKPLVYVSLGSSGDPTTYANILAALRELPVSAAVATAGTVDADTIAGGNIFAAAYLPGVDMARRAALVIGNGGSGSVYQALASGTPVLAFPRNMDQFMIMAQVTRAGAGAIVRKRDSSTARIRALVRELIDGDRYRAAGRRLAGEIARWDARARFNELLGKIA